MSEGIAEARISNTCRISQCVQKGEQIGALGVAEAKPGDKAAFQRAPTPIARSGASVNHPPAGCVDTTDDCFERRCSFRIAEACERITAST